MTGAIFFALGVDVLKATRLRLHMADETFLFLCGILGCALIGVTKSGAAAVADRIVQRRAEVQGSDAR